MFKILPNAVKAAVAGMDLQNDFDSVIEKADEVFLATKTSSASVAAVKPKAKNDVVKKPVTSTAGASAVSEDADTSADQSAFDQMNQLTAELAAFNKNFKKRGRGRGARGGPGRGQPKRGGQQRSGQPHPDDPPPGSCAIHQQHGRSAGA